MVGAAGNRPLQRGNGRPFSVIVAAAKAGDNEGEPPEALLLAWRTQRWGDPYGTGWMDWPAGLRAQMDTALNVYNLFNSVQGIPPGGMAKWATANPGAWDSLQNILKLIEAYDDNPD
ncbi:hypothetical protein KC887_01180 [Candidatus Kaiserbacteria bacterium]|nr:hypothetical protein [Candidatus Kaiserbacteria bacterium]